MGPVFPVEWAGRQAVVTLPEHIDVTNVPQLREQLLSLINRGAAVLIADMTSTASCDHAAMDVITRAYQRAAVGGTQLRLVVTAPVVRRVLGIEGLDRLVSIYPTLEAATAAGTPRTEHAASASRPGSRRHTKADRACRCAQRGYEPRPCCGSLSTRSATGWR